MTTLTLVEVFMLPVPSTLRLNDMTMDDVQSARRVPQTRRVAHVVVLATALSTVPVSTSLASIPTIQTSVGLPAAGREMALARDASGNIYQCTSGVVNKLAPDLSVIWSANIPIACTSLVVDSQGQVIVAGSTTSPDVPTRRAVDDTYDTGSCFSLSVRIPCTDAVVVKLTADGRDVVFGTYLGADGVNDRAWDVALAPDGSVLVTGETPSATFPTTTGGLTGVSQKGFLMRLAADGRLLSSTFLGGIGKAVSADAEGDVYVATDATDATGPWQLPADVLTSSLGRQGGAYLARLSSDFSIVRFARLIGNAQVWDMAVDAVGGIHVGGDWGLWGGVPIVAAFQPAQQRRPDAFIAKFSRDGSVLYSSPFGGDTGGESIRRIAADAEGATYVTGTSSSADFPSRDPMQSVEPRLGSNVRSFPFVAKVGPSGALVYATPLASYQRPETGNVLPEETGQDIAVAGDGSVYVGTFISSNPRVARIARVDHPLDPEALVVTGFAPTVAAASGGSVVRITGDRFADGVQVTVGGEAAWRVQRVDATSIDVTIPSGSGTASVVVTNPNGRRVTAPAALQFTGASACDVSASDRHLIVVAAGGARHLQLAPVPSGCAWQPWSDSEWLSAAAAGPATLSLTSLSNTDGHPRTGRIRIGRLEILVVQAPGPCVLAATPSSISVGGAAALGIIRLSTSAGCSVSQEDWPLWLTYISGDDQRFPDSYGVSRFAIAPNPSPEARQATLVFGAESTVRGLEWAGVTLVSVPVSQAGVASGCEAQPTSNTAMVGASGGPVILGVSAAPGCSWTAGSHETWVSPADSASGTGSGTTTWLVGANLGAARSGVVTVGGVPVTISQQGDACAIDLPWRTGGLSAAGGTGTVTVRSGPGCTWTATSNTPWLTVTRTGDVVTFGAQSHDARQSRATTISIGGQPFTVVQAAAGGCASELSKTLATMPASGGTDAFTLGTAAGCGWAVASDVSWIAPQPRVGEGPSVVSLSVAANAAVTPRVGTLTAGGRVYTVTQAGTTAGCAAALAATSAAFGRGASTGSIVVDAPATCAWLASSSVPWVTLTSGSQSVGPGIVTFAVAAHDGADTRSVALMVANQVFTIYQGGSAQTTLVSVTSAGEPGIGGQTPGATSAISGNGRIVAFLSSRRLTSVANNYTMAYVRDVVSGLTEAVSVRPSGEPPSNAIHSVALSADARHVFFATIATNLLPGTDDQNVDLFAFDRQTRALTRVGVGSSPTSSADGRFVAFSNYTQVTGNGAFVVDRDPDENGVFDEPGQVVTEQVSRAWHGPLRTGTQASLSADGRHVAFVSTDAVAIDDVGTRTRVYVHDRHTRRTVGVGISSEGHAANGESTVPSLSANGRFVAFLSSATNLDGADTNGSEPDVYVHDRDADEDGVFDERGAISTTRVSLAANGTQLGNLHQAQISADGGRVVFASGSAAYVRELVARRTTQINVDGAGQPILLAGGVAISASGRWATFASHTDVFVRDLLTSPPPPVLESIEPATGPTIGEALVTLRGRHLWWPSASFGAETVSRVSVVSPTLMRLSLPAHGAGTANVTVRDAEGRHATLPAAFTYLACAFTISPDAPVIPRSGGSATISVTTGPGCAWSAEASAPWLALTPPASASSSGSLTVHADPYYGALDRTAALRVGGRTLTITQPGLSSCLPDVQPTTITLGASGGVRSVTVSAASTCAWTRRSEVPWLVLASNANASGLQTVSFTVLPNPGGVRTGTLTIAGRTVTVNQAASTLGESSTLTSVTPSAGGDTGTVSVLIEGTGLPDGTMFHLRRAGYADITAQRAAIVDGQGRARFDLVGAATGVWDLVASHGGAAVVLPSAFTIEPGRTGELEVTIDGPLNPGAYGTARYVLTYRNPRNTDLYAAAVWLGGLPTGASAQLARPARTPGHSSLHHMQLDWSAVPKAIQTSEGTVLPLFVPFVPAGGADAVEVLVGVGAAPMTLQAWATPAMLDVPGVPAAASIAVTGPSKAALSVSTECAKNVAFKLAGLALEHLFPAKDFFDCRDAFVRAVGAVVVDFGELWFKADRNVGNGAMYFTEVMLSVASALAKCGLAAWSLFPQSRLLAVLNVLDDLVTFYKAGIDIKDIADDCIAEKVKPSDFMVVPSSQTTCRWRLLRPSYLWFGPEGGTQTIAVETGATCVWEIANHPATPWARVGAIGGGPASGTGPGLFAVTMDPLPPTYTHGRGTEWLYSGAPTSLAVFQWPYRGIYPRHLVSKLAGVVTLLGSFSFGFSNGDNATSGPIALPVAGIDGAVMLVHADGRAELQLPALSPGTYVFSVRLPSGQLLTDQVTVVEAQTDPAADSDADGMPDHWETSFNLDVADATDAGMDLDADGRSNLQEFLDGTHPRGRMTQFLAEGATGDFFDSRLSLVNPGASPATVHLRFLKPDGDVRTLTRRLVPASRTTIEADAIAGLEKTAFATVIESDVPIAADRTMTWDSTGYGSHAESALQEPRFTWYLAEGATHSGFDLFYLLQNPGDASAMVDVTYLLPAPRAPIVRSYVVGPQQRFNIWVDTEPGLDNVDVSAVIQVTNGQPIIVERAMYLPGPGKVFGAGHASAGIPAPATEWFLAEGATGNFFDLFVLIANPSGQTADVEATFLLPDGSTIVRRYAVEGQSRFNIWVDTEDARLADTAVSTVLRSLNGVPLVVERAMWWPGPTSTAWAEAHNSAGSVMTGMEWAVADGEVGGPRDSQTYLLISTPGAEPATVRVTILFEDGAPVSRDFAVAGQSRFNVDVGVEFPEAVDRRFGAVVDSLDDKPIVVERAMYSNAGSQVWAAGTSVLATRLR